jgi:hypothetical protein
VVIKPWVDRIRTLTRLMVVMRGSTPVITTTIWVEGQPPAVPASITTSNRAANTTEDTVRICRKSPVARIDKGSGRLSAPQGVGSGRRRS